MKKIILASKSPRRKELLEKANLPFQIIESNVIEQVDVENSPYEWVKAISAKKARAVSKMMAEPCIIIGADTIVTDLGKILQKPTDKNDACKMLKDLQGHKHTVYTGMTLIFKDEDKEEELNFVDATDVFMKSLTDYEILKYVETEEPFDKAGSYAIQGKGALLIEKIYGDYNTVVGLPLTILYDALKLHEINIMDYWK